ncbi:MAG: hypothetical protein IJ562_00435 [Prevotella sp.]|nr:hypothetical protein [Prevotella sp.]
MEFEQRKRNTPSATLVRNYLNKRSGKVVEARKEIQRRFEFLDWNIQKKVMIGFLTSGKTDREWAYRKLIDYWDRSYEPIVKSLWEQTHEPILAWSIIRYFPTDYLKQNVEQLGEGRNYYFLCLRLSDDKEFVVDESRLQYADLMHLLYVSHKPVSDEKARDILYGRIGEICGNILSDEEHVNGSITLENRYVDSYIYRNLLPEMEDRDERPLLEITMLFNVKSVISILHNLKRMGMQHIVNEYFRWNKMVISDILQSDDYKEMKAYDRDYYEQQQYLLRIIIHFCIQRIEEKYRPNETESLHTWKKRLFNMPEPKPLPTQEEMKSTLKSMRSGNSAVNNLIDKLDLELP